MDALRRPTTSSFATASATAWKTSSVGSPVTSFAKSGALHIAYQVLGDGPLDLVYVPSAFGHVEIMWENPSVERFLRQMAAFSRMIVFDKRGTGMSDRPRDAPTLAERADDIRAVMDAVGSRRAALFGMSDGGVIAAKFAASEPERVSHLIAMGSGPGTFVAPEIAEQAIARVAQEWGDGGIIEKGAPSVAHVPSIRAWTARLQQHSVSPGAMADLIRMNTTFDVRPDLPSVISPTLVLHRTGDLLYNIRDGRELAAGIAGARFVELPGTDHLPYFQDPDHILDLIEEFITGRPPNARSRQPDVPAGLSARECDVLRLVALGRTNQQIAADLYISTHTVSHHLRAIFAKTVTTNRTEASAFAHHHQLT
jgi:pimeloyl-ACP methyl ester carboxylesterase/DNA-binding CsgD family transcriptional regulator